MTTKVLKEALSPWINEVVDDFSRNHSLDYGTDILQFLHKNIDEEISVIYSSERRNWIFMQERASAVFTALTCIYNHLCVKITHQDCFNVEASSIRLLSQIIKTGLILSQGQPQSEWINRISEVMHLFTGSRALIYDACILVGTLKSKYHPAYLALMKSVLMLDLQDLITEPMAYMKIMLLFRRIKALSKDKATKSHVTSVAAKIKPPGDLMVWLESIFGRDAKSLQCKSIAKWLLGNKVPETVMKSVRNMVLSNYSESNIISLCPQSLSRKETDLFTIDFAKSDQPADLVSQERKDLDSELSEKILVSAKTKKAKAKMSKLKAKKGGKNDKKKHSILESSSTDVCHGPLNEDDTSEGDDKFEIFSNAGSDFVDNGAAVTSLCHPNEIAKTHLNIEEITISDSESPSEKEASIVAHLKETEKDSAVKEKCSYSAKKKKKVTSLQSSAMLEDNVVLKSDSSMPLSESDAYIVDESEIPTTEIDQSSDDYEIFYIDTVPKTMNQKSDVDENECCLSVKKRKSSENLDCFSDGSMKLKKKKNRKHNDSSLSIDDSLHPLSEVTYVEDKKNTIEKSKTSNDASTDIINLNADHVDSNDLPEDHSSVSLEDQTNCTSPNNRSLNSSSHSSEKCEADEDPDFNGIVDGDQQAVTSHTEADGDSAASCMKNQVMFSVFQKSPSWPLEPCHQVSVSGDMMVTPEDLNCSLTSDASTSPRKTDVSNMSISLVTSIHLSSDNDVDSGVGEANACGSGEIGSLCRKGKRKLEKQNDLPLDKDTPKENQRTETKSGLDDVEEKFSDKSEILFTDSEKTFSKSCAEKDGIKSSDSVSRTKTSLTSIKETTESGNIIVNDQSLRKEPDKSCVVTNHLSTDASTCALNEDLPTQSRQSEDELQGASPSQDENVNILPTEMKNVQVHHSNNISFSVDEIPLSECSEVQTLKKPNQNMPTECSLVETENDTVQSVPVPKSEVLRENSENSKNADNTGKERSAKFVSDSLAQSTISCELVQVEKEDVGSVQIPSIVEVAAKENDSGCLEEDPLTPVIKENSEQVSKNSIPNAENFKKFCLTLHNQINPMKVSEFTRVTRSLSKRISSSGETDRFPFSCEKENYLSFADLSSGPGVLTRSGSELISETLSFPQRLDPSKKDIIGSPKTVTVLKDDNISQFSEASDDWKSQDLFSDECDCTSDHSNPEIKGDIGMETKNPTENFSQQASENLLKFSVEDKTQSSLLKDSCDIGVANKSTELNLKVDSDISDSSTRKSLRPRNKETLEDPTDNSSPVKSPPVFNENSKNLSETPSTIKDAEKNKNPICLVEKLAIEPCRKSSKRGNSHSATPTKKYCFRHKSKPRTDESSKLEIDLSTLHLESPSRKLSLRKYTKMDEKLLAKMPILRSSLSQDNGDGSEQSSSTTEKPSEENTACYNLRNRKLILEPTKFKK